MGTETAVLFGYGIGLVVGMFAAAILGMMDRGGKHGK